jgi:phosphoglycolate phosphatase
MNTKKQKKLIIFDMDGTLINSGNIIANTINHVRLNSGLSKMDDKILLENINNPDINSAEFFYEVDAFTPRHSELFESYYEEHHLEEIVLYDGIKELLEELSQKPNSPTLTIATNAHTNFAISMTKHLDINRYFDYIIGADKVANHKPAPDMVNEVINRYKFDKDEIILIGDSHKDKIASDKAGIETILVNWGFTKFDDKKYQVAQSVEELGSVLI